MDRKIKKEIRQLIKEAQANGQTNKEIYNRLTEEYEDEETIARFIATMLKPKDKKKHCLYNSILLGFTVIVVLFNLWVIKNSPFLPADVEFLRFLCSSSFMAMLWYVGGSYMLTYVIVLSLICKKRITSYVFLMYTCSYLIFCFLLDVFVTWTFKWGIYWLYLAIDILSIVFIIFLARFFQRKIFPDYRYRKLKEDEEGEYIFS